MWWNSDIFNSITTDKLFSIKSKIFFVINSKWKRVCYIFELLAQFLGKSNKIRNSDINSKLLFPYIRQPTKIQVINR